MEDTAATLAETWLKLLSQGFDLALTLSADGQSTAVRHGRRRMADFDTAFLINRPLWELVHRGDRERVNLAFDAMTRDEASWFRLRLISSQGEAKRFNVRFVPAPDLLGEDLVGFFLADDASEQVRAEEEVGILKNRLDQASKAKSSFMSSVSHQLRTPLNAIIGFTQILSMGTLGELSPQQAESVGHIADSSNQLMRLIGDLLDYSRLEAGRMGLEIRDFDLPELVRQVVAAAVDKPGRGALDLDVDIQDEVNRLQADRNKVFQMLEALIDEIARLAPDGSRARVAAAVKAGHAHLTVGCRSLKLPAEELEAVFEPFQEVKRVGADSGTGLGLALARELALAHGGRVWAENQPNGEGGLFHLSLPLRSPNTLGASLEKELKRVRSKDQDWSLLLIRIFDYDTFRSTLPEEEFASFKAEVEGTIRRVIRDVDRCFNSDRAGVWVVLTPQPGDSARRTGDRIRSILLQSPFARELNLRAAMEVIPGLGGGEPGLASPSRILVVDDEPMIREVLEGLLRALGHQVEMARGGWEALDILTERPVDLLVTDIFMPDLSGKELILRARERGFEGPIIVVTGFEAGHQAARKLGVEAVLHKPMSMADFKEAIDKALAPSAPALSE